MYTEMPLKEVTLACAACVRVTESPRRAGGQMLGLAGHANYVELWRAEGGFTLRCCVMTGDRWA